jgi:transcriptional regulator with XRE-family HTH domain/mannose-6-phosphate isomerase-like protein (cupin superfamily)
MNRPEDSDPDTQADTQTAVPAGGGSAAGALSPRQEAKLGARLRAAREQRGLSVRGLSRELNVSASFLSQLENGKARPSVATLYAMSNALGVSIDDLFSDEGPDFSGAGRHAPAKGRRHANGRSDSVFANDDLGAPTAVNAVVRPGGRRRLELNSGVVWEQLAAAGTDADFMLVTYDIGGSSTPDERLIRHQGMEYGYIIKGTLEVVIGFESHLLEPGDSIAFSSATPHRLRNVGDEPVEAIWFVRDRGDLP